MRWLVACLIVLAATRASARIVIMDPPMSRACPHGASWDAITKCLVSHGSAPHVIGTLARAKLVRVDQDAEPIAILLYVRAGPGWKIGGYYEARGGTSEILVFEPFTIAHHTGYHVEIGSAKFNQISLDGVTTTPSVELSKTTLYCSGETLMCPHAVTSCDVFVHGKAMWSFRGALKLEANLMTVAGDRTMTGGGCSSSERVFLGWPET